MALALCCVASGASAQEQDGPFYDGTWTARLRCQDGSACLGRVVIKDFAGTWQEVGGKSACGAKKLPLTVQASTRSLLAFTAFGDVVKPACPTLTIVVKPVNPKALEGTVDSDAHGHESPEVHARHTAPDPVPTGPGLEAGGPPDGSSKTARPIRLERR